MSSPMMQQFHAAKREHPDGLLFFRMGDFYELFLEDAERAAELLGLTLTSRSKGEGAIPMAGVPYRNVDPYIRRLIALGLKVVICDQMQDPSEAKGIVERAVTRVITPGTILEEDALPEKKENYLAALWLSAKAAGLAYADLSTAAFFVEEVPLPLVLEAVSRIDPAEILVPESARDAGSPYQRPLGILRAARSFSPDWRFDPEEGARSLLSHFRVARLDGFGVSDLSLAIGAAGALIEYLRSTQKGAVQHLTRLQKVVRSESLILDRTTCAALEVVKSARDGSTKGTLFAILDRTQTPMGARLLRRWLLEPMAIADRVMERQEGVRVLHADDDLRAELRVALKRVQDIDRLLSRVSCGRGTARELVGLRQSLGVLPAVRELSTGLGARVIDRAREQMPSLEDLVSLLGRGLLDEVPLAVREGGLIRPGFDPELDELRDLGTKGKEWIAEYQAKEQVRTGIPSLKVAFNKVFGYYIEITHLHSARVPPDYVRKQTVKNAERYITADLKAYEEKVLGAEERIFEREYEHFQRFRQATLDRLRDIQTAAEVLAFLDALQSMAEVATERRYVAPTVDDSKDLEIVEGRHPVLDAELPAGTFVPNDVRLLSGSRELILITGPNMAGKSTYIRQAALLVLMAQAGSFVPAASARIGVADRIFTRIGASDELLRGNSTFMVEMLETAEILNSATARSLVILDEVGRGTSTFDGLAIAWAISEHLAEKIHARTFFATHYHQLLDLAARLSNVCNMNVAVREWGDEIVFLHKIVEGGTDRSYGIHVARLAGLPKPVLKRAETVLAEFESSGVRSTPKSGDVVQLGLFESGEDPLRKALAELDLDRLTPIDALLALKNLRDQA